MVRERDPRKRVAYALLARAAFLEKEVESMKRFAELLLEEHK